MPTPSGRSAKFRSVEEYAAAQGFTLKLPGSLGSPSTASRRRRAPTPPGLKSLQGVTPSADDLGANATPAQTAATNKEKQRQWLSRTAPAGSVAFAVGNGAGTGAGAAAGQQQQHQHRGGKQPTPGPLPTPTPVLDDRNNNYTDPRDDNATAAAAAAMAKPAAAGDNSLVRQARPIGGSYCIISITDSDEGALIKAYDSDACVEKTLNVPWGEVSDRVGQQVAFNTPIDDKRPLFGKLLQHVSFDAGPKGSHDLKLTQAAAARPESKDGYFEDDEGILFDRPGERNNDLTRSQLMTPGTPGGSPDGFGNSKRKRKGAAPPQSPITDPSKANGRRRSSGRMSKSRHSKSARSLPRISTPNSARPRTAKATSTRAVAGYKPPTDMSRLDDDVLNEARSLTSNDKKLIGLLKDPVFVMAAKRVGVAIDELQPRTTLSFRTGPTPMAKLKLMHSHYENRRVLSIALVLGEIDAAQATIDKRRKGKESYVRNISDGFMKTLDKERRRVQNIRVARRKIEVVAENENEILKERRIHFEKRLEDMAARHRRLEEKKEQQKEYMARRSAERQVEIMRVQQQKEEREAARIQHIREAAESRGEILERHRKEREEAERAKRQMLAEREIQRQRKREDVKQGQTLRRQMLLEQIQQKGAASAKIKEQREAEIEAKRAERWLVAQSRQENATRVRREKEFHQKEVMVKIKQAYEMMDHMKELRQAVVEERKKQKRDMIIEVDQWKASTKLERSVTPGPGEYETRQSLEGPTGGTWGKYRPKSDLEWIIYRASQLPGPGQYNDVDLTKLVTGGTWGKYAPKSDVEWQIYRASQIPGPGEYEPRPVPSGSSTTFGNFNPKSDLDVIIANAKDLPGPADYAAEIPPVTKPTIKSLKKKLQKAGKTVQIANLFVSRTSTAARASAAKRASGIEPRRSVTQEDVKQVQRMVKAVNASKKAEKAAARGDAEAAERHADEAVLHATRIGRDSVGTGTQAGMDTVASDSTKVAARTAGAAAVRARRASQAAAEEAARAAAEAEEEEQAAAGGAGGGAGAGAQQI